MVGLTAGVLREHLAYEIYYLLLAACRFPEIDGREATIIKTARFCTGATYSNSRSHHEGPVMVGGFLTSAGTRQRRMPPTKVG
jgi:hypothetical protein